MPKKKKAQSQPFDRKKLGLNSAQLKELDECEAELVKIGRRTTKETFDLGERLAVAQELVPLPVRPATTRPATAGSPA